MAGYDDALAEAQSLGYAERDPTADVEGYDAGAKAAIIASIAFGAKVVAGDVYHEGISGITGADIAIGDSGSGTSSSCSASSSDPATARSVCGCTRRWCRCSHPLASVRDSYNAVFVEGEAVGSLMFYGRGAGGSPTASAVLGDVIDAAINLRKGTHGSLGMLAEPASVPIDETSAEYLPQPRRRRPSRRAARRHRRVRAHDVSASARGAGRARRRRPARVHHARRPRVRRAGHRSTSCATSRSSDSVGGLLRVIGD